METKNKLPEFIYARIIFLTNYSKRSIDSGSLIKLKRSNPGEDPLGVYTLCDVLKANYGIKNNLITLDFETSYVSDPDRNTYQLEVHVVERDGEIVEVTVLNDNHNFFIVKTIYNVEDDNAALLLYEIGE